MKQRIAFALILIVFAMSGALHYREYRKSQEISDILRIQAEIEFKRTSLMVVYQEVLQSHETDADFYCRNQRRRGKILCFRDVGGGGGGPWTLSDRL